jgi:hypothetical protein
MDDAQTELLLTTAPFGEKSLELLQKTEFEADFSTHEAEFEADFSSDEAANAAAALLKKAEHQGRKALKLQKHETAAAAAAALLKKAEHQGRKAVRHEAASAKLEKMPKKKRSAALSSAEHPLPSLPPKVGAAETSANRWLESPHFTQYLQFLGSRGLPWQYQRERSLSLSATVDALHTVSALALTSSVYIVTRLSCVIISVLLVASTRGHK